MLANYAYIQQVTNYPRLALRMQLGEYDLRGFLPPGET